MVTNLPLQSTQRFDIKSPQLLNILDKYSKFYENVAFMGEFNVTMDDRIDKPKCYKNFENQHALHFEVSYLTQLLPIY